MEGAISVVVLIGIMAMLVEQLIERFLGKVLDGEKIIYASLIMGVVVCVLLRLDIIAPMLATVGIGEPVGAPYTGQVITGIIVGSGANFYHKVFQPTAPSVK